MNERINKNLIYDTIRKLCVQLYSMISILDDNISPRLNAVNRISDDITSEIKRTT